MKQSTRGIICSMLIGLSLAGCSIAQNSLLPYKMRTAEENLTLVASLAPQITIGFSISDKAYRAQFNDALTVYAMVKEPKMPMKRCKRCLPSGE